MWSRRSRRQTSRWSRPVIPTRRRFSRRHPNSTARCGHCHLFPGLWRTRMADVVIQVRDLEVTYGWGRNATRVLHGITLDVAQGRTVAVVGESGSGKSTLAKTLVGAVRPSAGNVTVAGVEVASARGARRTAMRRKVQLIPQDPYSSLDPRRTIGEALAEAVDPRRAK